MYNGYRKIVERGYHQFKASLENWDNPEFVRRASHDPFYGGFYSAHYNEKMAEENVRKWQDRKKYTGESWTNSPYPWTAYMSTEGSVSSGPGDYFEATEAIISQNFARLSRWTSPIRTQARHLNDERYRQIREYRKLERYWGVL